MSKTYSFNWIEIHLKAYDNYSEVFNWAKDYLSFIRVLGSFLILFCIFCGIGLSAIYPLIGVNEKASQRIV
jgi:hypothetical protein